MPSELVCVLDDDADLAASVARLLDRAGYRTIAWSDPSRLLDELAVEPVHCIVTDISMPGMSGFDLADAVRAADEGVSIVFMTGWPTTGDAVAAIRRHGGIDYLDKPLSQERLLSAVAEGVDWSLRKRAALAQLSPLSPRERDVLCLLAKGFSNKLVAAELDLSVRTVEDHRASIMRKTGASNLSELVELLAALRR